MSQLPSKSRRTSGRSTEITLLVKRRFVTFGSLTPRQISTSAFHIFIFIEHPILKERMCEHDTGRSRTRTQRARTTSYLNVVSRGIHAIHDQKEDPGQAEDIPSPRQEQTRRSDRSKADTRKRQPSCQRRGATAIRGQQPKRTDYDSFSTSMGECIARSGLTCSSMGIAGTPGFD